MSDGNAAGAASGVPPQRTRMENLAALRERVGTVFDQEPGELSPTWAEQTKVVLGEEVRHKQLFAWLRAPSSSTTEGLQEKHARVKELLRVVIRDGSIAASAFARWVMDVMLYIAALKEAQDWYAECVHIAIVAIVRDGKVLAALRPSDKEFAGHWELPGGKLHHHEEPFEAARREAWEELGVEINSSDMVYLGEWPDDKGERMLHLIATAAWTGTPHAREGQPELRWEALASLAQLTPCVPSMGECAARLKAFSATGDGDGGDGSATAVAESKVASEAVDVEKWHREWHAREDERILRDELGLDPSEWA